MRPPEFTGGNSRKRTPTSFGSSRGFNEAAGIHRRKPGHFLIGRGPTNSGCFNEAAGIHRRKHWKKNVKHQSGTGIDASMRPPEFTGGNADDA